MKKHDTFPQYFMYKGEKFETTNTLNYIDPLNRWFKVKHLASGICLVYLNELDNPRNYAEEIYQFLESQKKEKTK